MRSIITGVLCRRLLAYAESRYPDFEIGGPLDPYIRRWYLIPRRKYPVNAYLHHMKRSDDDRALHDHPWVNLSIVLKGGFWEIVPQNRQDPAGPTRRIWRYPGAVVLRRPSAAHRLELPYEGAASWSLFLTGPKIREWGFWCPKGWKHWEVFVKSDAPGEIGPGCGEG